MKECKHCNEVFDQCSTLKRRVGGYFNECPSCVLELQTEAAVKYRGVVGAEGKMAAISIVAFNSEHEADAYVSSFNSCGFGKRKVNECNHINHYHIGNNIANSNHKGKK
jgi:hypothetical protein